MSQDREMNDDIQLLKEMIDEVVKKQELEVKILENQIKKTSKSLGDEIETLRADQERLKKTVEELISRKEASTDSDYRAPVVKLKKVSAPVRVQPRKTAEAPAAVKLERVVVDDALNPAPTPTGASTPEEVPTPEEAPQQTSITSTAVSADSHRKCPSCGNQRKSLIHEAIDRTNMINVYPKMYGKKYRCGSCGGEWRIRNNKLEVLK